MAQSVTIAAKSSDGEQYQITFAKTGADTGTITLDPDNGSATSFNVRDIKASKDNSVVTCKAGPWPFTQDVTCSAVQEHGKNLVRVSAKIFGTKEYEISKDGHDSLTAFIAKAGFPH